MTLHKLVVIVKSRKMVREYMYEILGRCDEIDLVISKRNLIISLPSYKASQQIGFFFLAIKKKKDWFIYLEIF